MPITAPASSARLPHSTIVSTPQRTESREVMTLPRMYPPDTARNHRLYSVGERCIMVMIMRAAADEDETDPGAERRA